MRKIFTTLKSVVAATVISAMALATSCSYDDTAVKNEIQEIKVDLKALADRVSALEQKLQDEVQNLQDLIDGLVVVVDVVTDADGNQTIQLSDGREITVLAPVDCTCEPAEPCQCDPLQYRVVDGVLEVSADGYNWFAINNVSAECVVANIVINDDHTATITLANGEEFTVVKADLIEFDSTRGQVYVAAGTTSSVGFTINDAVADINIMNQPFGWKAAVEVAPADEDDVDPGMGILAAGGTEFVLKISAPSVDLVNAGFAEKEGVVSVHFNTANGACKVAKMVVNLAEITLDVDAQGNITIVNSLAVEQTNYWGEVFVDFADFFIGIMPMELYEQYGDNALIEDFGSWDYTTAAVTQRSSGLWNVANLQEYQEGVYEKEVIELTVDQLATAFYPKYEFQIGSEYVIFISTESELVNYYQIPVLNNAIMAEYKKTVIEAEYVADSATWNDALFHFSLAGYQNYLIGWLPVAEVSDYINNGMAATVEEFLPLYISGYGLMSSGAIITGDIIDQDIYLSQLAEMSLMEWAPELSANTEYHFFVYPFFAETEMEFYQHEFVAENLKYVGTFATAPLIAGDFDANAAYDVIEHVEDNIEVEVTLSEEVAFAYYTWLEEPQADPEEAAYLILNDVYAQMVVFDEYTTSIEASKYGYYGLPNPIYLGIVAINANGEYVYVEQEFKYVEPEPVVLTSFEYKGRHLDLDDNAETSGGDHVYVATAEDGTEFTIGLYYLYADAAGVITEGEYDYCTNYFDAMYSYWNGFVIVSDTTYNGSSLIVDAETITLKLKGVGKYIYTKTGEEGGEEPEEPETPDYSALEFTSAKLTGSYNDANVYFYTEDQSYALCLNFYGIIDSGCKYIPEGSYQFGTSYGVVYTYNYSYLWDYATSSKILKFDSGYGEVLVSEVDGKYRIEVKDAMCNDATIPYNCVYEGLIENLILPSEYVAPVQVEFTPVRGEYDFTFDLYEYNGGDAEYAFWLYDANNNYLEVICRFGNHTGWDYVYEVQYVSTDGSVFEPVTVQTQKPSDYNCNAGEKYFSVKATAADNSYIMFSGCVPSVEVNYLGEGSTYAPGSENGGGVTPEPEPEPTPGEVTELTIVSHAVVPYGALETEVHFTDIDGNMHVVDFRMGGIEAGTYNSDDNGIFLNYCRYMYGSSDFGGGVIFDSANATITDNGDTTFTFDVTFVAEGAAYHFTYTTPAEEQAEGPAAIALNTKSAGEKVGSYAYGWTLSDAEGQNQVKLVVDEYYSYDSAADFPKANEYTTWQSSPTYISNGSHFSFVNNSLVIDGVTYANADVEGATLSVVTATSITITVKIAGVEYTLVYSI